jgi:nucleosome binding factor SPN SPT16 subunit
VVAAEGAYDPDEYEDEARQRKMVSKLNKTFSQFCLQSLELARSQGFQIGDGDLELVNTDQMRTKGFLGIPNKEMVLVQPTNKCLVNLSDKDPFVLCVDEN